MAEALANNYIQNRDRLKGKIQVSSAGIFASESDRSTYMAIQVMRGKGIDSLQLEYKR